MVDLKFSAIRDDGSLLQSVLHAGSESQHAEIVRAFRSRHTVRWMLSTASPLLRRAGHVVLERFLRLATFEAASAKTFQRRLFYESAAWDRKFALLYSLLDSAARWFESTDQMIQFHLQPQYNFRAVDSVADELDLLVQNARSTASILKEVVRGAVQEGAYDTHILQLFWRQEATVRQNIGDKYIVHLYQ